MGGGIHLLALLVPGVGMGGGGTVYGHSLIITTYAAGSLNPVTVSAGSLNPITVGGGFLTDEEIGGGKA